MLVDVAASLLPALFVYTWGTLLFGAKRARWWLALSALAFVWTFLSLKIGCELAITADRPSTVSCVHFDEPVAGETRMEKYWRRFKRESNWTFP